MPIAARCLQPAVVPRLLLLWLFFVVAANATATPTVSSTPSSFPYPWGLLGLWEFNGDGADSVGSNPCTPVNAAWVTDRDGRPNAAMQLGGNGYCALAQYPFTADPIEDFTIRMVFRPTLIDASYHSLVGYQYINVTNRMPSMWVSPGGGLHNDMSTTTHEREAFLTAPGLMDNVSYHTAVWSKLGASSVVYLDGAVVLSNPVSAYHWRGGPGPYAIGRTDNYFVGVIDEVAIWGRGLTPVEVRGLFTRSPTQSPTITPTQSQTSSPTLSPRHQSIQPCGQELQANGMVCWCWEGRAIDCRDHYFEPWLSPTYPGSLEEWNAFRRSLDE